MFETLFGEGQYGIKFVFAFIVVLAFIALTAWLVRRFGAERLGAGTMRGRQPRLAVIDAASVDGRRRLVLIRRDNVEHLMMIGGPTDVVVEANIVRAAGPPREAQAPRPPAATDTLPRAVPLGEGSMWPLQPEPAPAPPPQRIEPPALPRVTHRHTQPPPPPPSVTAEEELEWNGEPEPAPPPPPSQPPQHRPRVSQDPLAGLADEIARNQPPQAQPAPAASAEPRPARRETRFPRPQAAMPPAPPPPPAPAPEPPQATEPPFNSPADQNLAEMAHRLEVALRRPGKPDGFAEPPPRTAQGYEAGPGETEAYESPPPQRAPAAESRPARSEARPARADRTAAGAPKSSLYDSLEQEMASLLGRPDNKT